MKYDSGRFEGGYRLMHIHNTKRRMFLVQAAIVLIFAAYLVYAGGGFSIKPFYLSINSFLYFVLLMTLLILAEAYVFTALEMRFVNSESAKFLITQRTFRSALVWTVAWVLILLLFVLPFLPGVVAESTQSRGELMATSSEDPASFVVFNTDAFGLTEISKIEVEAMGEVEVFVLTDYNYQLFQEDGMEVLGGYRVNVDDYMATPDLTIAFPDMPHGKFYVLFYSLNDVPAEVDYVIEREVSEILMDYMPLMSVAFVAVNGVAMFYMFTINRRYKQGIYR
jgi:hypothetical protein